MYHCSVRRVQWVGGVEKWGDKAQTWEPISAVKHVENFDQVWRPRIKVLLDERAAALKKQNETLEDIRAGKKRKGKSTLSSAAARETYACSQVRSVCSRCGGGDSEHPPFTRVIGLFQIYAQRHPKARDALEKRVDFDDHHQVCTRMDIFKDVAVFERLHRGINEGVLHELEEIFAAFEKEAAHYEECT